MNDTENFSEDRELPGVFWTPAVGVTTSLVDQPKPDDSVQWAPSFTALGFDYHDAMAQCLNTESHIIHKTLRTIEDVYLHLKGIKELGDVPAPRFKVNEPKPKSTKNPALQTATDEWHLAVQQRKDAISQWDAYVVSKRDAMRALK